MQQPKHDLSHLYHFLLLIFRFPEWQRLYPYLCLRMVLRPNHEKRVQTSTVLTEFLVFSFVFYSKGTTPVIKWQVFLYIRISFAFSISVYLCCLKLVTSKRNTTNMLTNPNVFLYFFCISFSILLSNTCVGYTAKGKHNGKIDKSFSISVFLSIS